LVVLSFFGEIEMRIKRFSVLVSFLLIFLCQFAAAAGTAGTFQWPFGPASSYKSAPDQYDMQWNSAFGKYHLADDWNGIGGGSTDLGNSLYAISNGVVISVDATGTTVPSVGKAIKVRYTLPDGKQIDSVYMHLLNVFVAANAQVSSGQLIATIGDGNGYYAGNAHLHWEIRTDLGLDLLTDPYYNPLTVTTALKYTSPSLFVDDRASGGVVIPLLSSSAWTPFTVSQYAASTTAFVQDQAGNRYSIKKAVDAGIIANWGVIYQGTNGAWYYYPDVTQATFSPGVNYQIYAQAPSLNLVVLYPGNHYKADRARMDIIRAAAQDSRFKNVLTETYAENLAWDPSWELRSIGISLLNIGTQILPH
jgi:hypothetical protein